MTTMTLDELIDAAEDRARDLGAQHGKQAGARVDIPDQETARRILIGIRDGDPVVLDALPDADLSGQWADDLSSETLPAAVDYPPEPTSLAGRSAWDMWSTGRNDLATAYENGFAIDVVDEVTSRALYHLACENESAAVQAFIDGDQVTCAGCYRPLTRAQNDINGPSYWAHEQVSHNQDCNLDEDELRPVLVSDIPSEDQGDEGVTLTGETVANLADPATTIPREDIIPTVAVGGAGGSDAWNPGTAPKRAPSLSSTIHHERAWWYASGRLDDYDDTILEATEGVHGWRERPEGAEDRFADQYATIRVAYESEKRTSAPSMRGAWHSFIASECQHIEAPNA